MKRGGETSLKWCMEWDDLEETWLWGGNFEEDIERNLNQKFASRILHHYNVYVGLK